MPLRTVCGDVFHLAQRQLWSQRVNPQAELQHTSAQDFSRNSGEPSPEQGCPDYGAALLGYLRGWSGLIHGSVKMVLEPCPQGITRIGRDIKEIDPEIVRRCPNVIAPF